MARRGSTPAPHWRRALRAALRRGATHPRASGADRGPRGEAGQHPRPTVVQGEAPPCLIWHQPGPGLVPPAVAPAAPGASRARSGATRGSHPAPLWRRALRTDLRRGGAHPHATGADLAPRCTAGTHPRPTLAQGATHCPAARGHASPRHGRRSRHAWRAMAAPPAHTGRALPRHSDRAVRSHEPLRHGRGPPAAWRGGENPPPHTDSERGTALPHLARSRPRRCTPGGPPRCSRGAPPPFRGDAGLPPRPTLPQGATHRPAAPGRSPPRHGRGSRAALHGGDAPPTNTGAGRDALPCSAGPRTPALRSRITGRVARRGSTSDPYWCSARHRPASPGTSQAPG